MLIIVLSFVISYSLVAIMLPRVLILSLKRRLIDPIDPRKVHSVPASRLGGVTFLPSLLFSLWFSLCITHIAQPLIGFEVYIDIKVIWESLALLSLFLIGIYDDILGVAYRNKFLVQIFAALLITLSGSYFRSLHGLFGIYEISPWIGIPTTIFLYVFITNALNLIDGIDGLASLLSIMALMVYGLLLYANGQIGDSLLAFSTLGALIPFCYHNVFGIKDRARSKIFMGDTGALVIGAILGVVAIKIWSITTCIGGDSFAPIFYTMAYTMLIIPCFDVVRVILHRFRAKRALFLPDKSHIHHKFMALGYTADVALGWIIALNLLFVTINMILSYSLNITLILLIDITLWTLIQIYISRLIEIRGGSRVS
ncbi:MAG: MraY family glycosyltransferase [Rikenellaceae bacterium]